jgi:hypothetical protein
MVPRTSRVACSTAALVVPEQSAAVPTGSEISENPLAELTGPVRNVMTCTEARSNMIVLKHSGDVAMHLQEIILDQHFLFRRKSQTRPSENEQEPGCYCE